MDLPWSTIETTQQAQLDNTWRNRAHPLFFKQKRPVFVPPLNCSSAQKGHAKNHGYKKPASKSRFFKKNARFWFLTTTSKKGHTNTGMEHHHPRPWKTQTKIDQSSCEVKSFVKGSPQKDMEVAPCHAVTLDQAPQPFFSKGSAGGRGGGWWNEMKLIWQLLDMRFLKWCQMKWNMSQIDMNWKVVGCLLKNIYMMVMVIYIDPVENIFFSILLFFGNLLHQLPQLPSRVTRCDRSWCKPCN